jgi:transcriptional antiterminator
MENINSLRDEKTGRFKTTTDSTRYKMVQFNNQRMSAYAREMCVALNIPKIPKGFIIHHLDEDKRNNNIDNLALITITAHNRIHAHEAWNKGKKTSENTLYKQRVSTDKHYLKLFKETHELSLTNLTQQEIADKLGISRATVSMRIKRYKELYEKYN